MLRELSCREFIEFLMAYQEGELPQEERRVFDEHLARCPYCVDYLRSYQAAVDLGKAAFRASQEPLPEEVPAELVDAILAALPGRS